MKVLHLLSTNKFSGAENVVCQIINMFQNETNYKMFYCSPDGEIKETLKNKNIDFVPIKSLTYKELRKIVKNIKPDIIHAHDVKASILASLFNKKCKVISHIHGNSLEMRKVSIKSLLYLICSKRFKHIFWVSNSCFFDYKYSKKIEDKSSILVNVINTQRINELAKEKGMTDNYDVIYVGRLVQLKNPLRMIKIFESVCKEKYNAKLAIIGDGVMFNEIQEYITSHNLKNNIDLLGFKNNPYKYIYKSKMMILTSIYEGTPMCVLEAMALGKPIISTPTDGLIDLIKQDYNGFLSDKDEELETEIISLINDQEKLSKMSKNVIKEFNKFNDIEKYKNEIKNKYETE